MSLSEKDVKQLDQLRDYVMWEDNDACFIERDCALLELEHEVSLQPREYKYSFMLSHVLDHLSTPMHDQDMFLGRMVQGRMWGQPTFLLSSWNHPENKDHLYSTGHFHPDYPTLLEKGLRAIVAEARATADFEKTKEARDFVYNSEVCVEAIGRFAHRYARNARYAAQRLRPEQGDGAMFRRAADAMDQVPMGPARTMFEALQSILFISMIIHCVIGTRDLGVGWLDRYLYPYYKRDIESGRLTRDEAVHMLANFLMMMNLIGGTRSDQYPHKPIWSQASNQYLLLCGLTGEKQAGGNDLTLAILEAAQYTDMPQPALMVYLTKYTDPDLRSKIMEHAVRRKGQVQFYNADVHVGNVLRQGIAPEIAYSAAHHACCLFTLPYYICTRHTNGGDIRLALMIWMLLNEGVDNTKHHPNVDGIPPVEEMTSFDQVEKAFHKIIRSTMLFNDKRAHKQLLENNMVEPYLSDYNFESLLLRGCVEKCRDCMHGGLDIYYHAFDCSGVATAADSLMTIRRLVFEEKRYTMKELKDICAADFEGHEELRQEIINKIPKFGNDNHEVDGICKRMMDVYFDTAEELRAGWGKNVVTVPGIYHLWIHNTDYTDFPATPDGRHKGDPINENESPTYGADRSGLPALLRSLVCQGTDRLLEGGLNVRFGGPIPAKALEDTVTTYFEMGGYHMANNFIDRASLEDAMAHPEKYRSLQVRMYGYSAFYTQLPRVQQLEILHRTEY